MLTATLLGYGAGVFVMDVHGRALEPAAGRASQRLPRTPDGHPDFQGTWDTSSATPLERPKEFADRPFFTEAEAREFERHGLDRFRESRGELEVITNGELNGSWSESAKVGRNLRTSIIVDPPDGRLPALTPAASARIAARVKERSQHPFDNPEDLPLGARCVVWGAGPPMLPMPVNSHAQIVQTPAAVMILSEMIHDVRVVALDGRPHLPAGIHEIKGDPRGRWEGDTLVIESTNFTAATELRGSTPARHVVERLSLLDADTLEYQFTVDDPAAYTRPWSGELEWRRTAERIFEYACHEANYSLEMILRGARAAERK